MRRIKIVLTGLVILSFSLCLAKNLNAVQVGDEEPSKGIKETKEIMLPGGELQLQEPKTPDFVPGELIVKLKEGKTLDDIKELNDKYKVTSTEKVFKEAPDHKKTLEDLKTKLSALDSKEHQGWYWQMDKDSPEYKDYIARIEKEKAGLTKQIKAKEMLIAKLEQRQKRVPEGTTMPNIENIYLLKTENKSANILSMADNYKANPTIEYAEPNYIATVQMIPNDPYYSSSNSWGQGYDDLWGLKKIQAAQAWDISQGEGVVVAVVDTGIDYNHEDIGANVWTSTGEIPNNGIDDDANGYIDDVRGWDFVGASVFTPQPDNNPMDGHGHGSHCAGTIAAIGNNFKGIIGVAPRAKVMALKGLDDNGTGSFTDLANAIKYAADNGADVISNSWGPNSRSPSNSTAESAIDYAYAKGCVIVFAAGNNNDDATYYSPSNYSKVITVASSDHNDAKSDFSNWGAKIDVAAPGGDSKDASANRIYQNILSLRATNIDMYGDGNNIVGTNYFRVRGTSMACPHVSGLAALVLARRPLFTNEEVRQVIRSSADDIDLPGLDVNSGYGRINAYNALNINSVCVALITSPVSNDMLKTASMVIQGSAYGQDFLNYKLEYATSSSGPWTEFFSSYTPVYNAELGRLELTATGMYYLRLTVNDKNNLQFQGFCGPILYDEDLHPGWPNYVSSCHYYFSPTPFTVEDVDNDRKKEIIVGTSDGKVHIFKENGVELTGWPIQVDSDIVSDISVADIDGNGDLEIFFVSFNSYVYGYHHSGVAINGWPKRANTGTFGSYALLIGDVDACGQLEIIVLPGPFTTYAGAPLRLNTCIFKVDGTLLTNWLFYDKENRSVWLGNNGSLGDVNNDGKLEIVVPMIDTNDTNAYLFVFNYQGDILAKLKLEGITFRVERIDGRVVSIGGPSSSIRPVLGDLDKDGDVEICTTGVVEDAVYTNKLYIWSYNDGSYTNMVTKNIGGGGNACQLALGDVDNNGDLEILLGTRYLEAGYLTFYSQVKVFNHDGSLRWQTDKNDIYNSFLLASPIIGDINSDNKKEIIMTSSNFYKSTQNILSMYIYNSDGSKNELFSRYSLPIFASYHFCPGIITDLDNNGTIELVALDPESGLIAVWDLASVYNSDTMDWPMFQHDPQHTGFIPSRDSTAPVTPVVTAGSSYSSISASWYSSDNESGIAEYRYKITQDSITGPVIKDWTSTGTSKAVSLTADSLNLQYDKTYYFLVKAKNGAGLWSEIGFSDGIQLLPYQTQTQTPWKTNENGTLYTNQPWNYTLGYHFTPQKSGQITKLGGFFNGTKTVYLWDKTSGVLLAQANVTSSNNWNYTTITPVPVEAGQTYTIATYIAGSGGSYRYVFNNFPQTYIDIRIEGTTHVSGNVRPTNIFTTAMYGQVDIEFVPSNNPPVLAAVGNKSVSEGQLLQFTISATDQDGDALTYSASNLPSGATFSGQNFSWTPSYSQAGAYSGIHFEVSDGKGGVDYEDITITVNNVNRAPIANSQSVTTNEDTPKAITLTASDPDGDSLTYSIVTNPIHGTLSGTAPNLTYTPTANYFGSDSFTFKANDTKLDSNIATVSITINSVNDPPTANVGPDKTATVGQAVSFSGSGSDIDGTISSYAWNFGDGTTGSGSTTSHTYSTAGNYTVTLTVTDNEGATGTDSCIVTVSSTGDAWDPTDNTGSSATQLANPTTTEQAHGLHTLSSTDLYDWFKVYLTSGASYNFNAIGGSGDNYGELYSDSSGTTRVAFDDDSGGNYQFSLNYTSTSTAYYYLRVRAYSIGNVCSYTLKYKQTSAPVQPPAAPSNLTATSVSSSQINLSWMDNSNNETGFKIERKTGSTGTYSLIATVGANVSTYSNTGLTAGTTYYYRIRAYNSNGDSTYSNEVNATTQSGVIVPLAPTNLTAQALSATSVKLTWSDNSTNETGFTIQRALNSSFTSGLVTNTVGANTTTYTSTGLTKNKTYYYRVRAYNSGGDSNYSNIVSATTPKR